jgi:hypothetical protein
MRLGSPRAAKTLVKLSTGTPLGRKLNATSGLAAAMRSTKGA